MGYQKDNSDTKFYRAVRKYGVENFTIEMIDSAINQEDLDDKEVYWINKYDSVNSGYNSKSTKGKCGGDTLSGHPNIKRISEKIRKSKLGDKNPMRISGGLKGVLNGMYGMTGKRNPSAKRCVAISEDGNTVLHFDTLKELQCHFNVTTVGMITLRCQGKTRSTYKGYYFKYYEDYAKSQSTIESEQQM